MCKELLELILLMVDADAWQFWGKRKLIFYVPPSLFKKRSVKTSVESKYFPSK